MPQHRRGPTTSLSECIGPNGRNSVVILRGGTREAVSQAIWKVWVEQWLYCVYQAKFLSLHEPLTASAQTMSLSSSVPQATSDS